MCARNRSDRETANTVSQLNNARREDAEGRVVLLAFLTFLGGILVGLTVFLLVRYEQDLGSWGVGLAYAPCVIAFILGVGLLPWAHRSPQKAWDSIRRKFRDPSGASIDADKIIFWIGVIVTLLAATLLVATGGFTRNPWSSLLLLMPALGSLLRLRGTRLVILAILSIIMFAILFALEHFHILPVDTWPEFKHFTEAWVNGETGSVEGAVCIGVAKGMPLLFAFLSALFVGGLPCPAYVRRNSRNSVDHHEGTECTLFNRNPDFRQWHEGNRDGTGMVPLHDA